MPQRTARQKTRDRGACGAGVSAVLDAGYREFAVVLAIAVTIYGDSHYLLSVLRGQTKPHVFTWFIWGIVGSVGIAAQIVAGGGVGAWPGIYSTAFCLLFSLLALRHGEKNITRSDWLCFAAALTAIAVWVVTHNPLWSVIIVSLIDALAYFPTFRKSWHKPHEEALTNYICANIKVLLVMAALEQLNPTTILYPSVVFIMNAVFIGMALWRRRVLKVQAAA